MRNKSLPGILWVAARPPVPPFSGITSKTLCGITALSSLTRVEVVSFVEERRREEVELRFQEYWEGRVASSHWVAYGPRKSSLQALLERRFQFGTEMESSSLMELLDRLLRESPDRLLLFDDITLAPFLARYGENAIMSPHDCMSRMFSSHLQRRPLGWEAARLLLQSRIARRYEREYYHLALLTHVITQRDRIWLEEINPRARYEVVPNADLLNPGFSPSRPNGWDLLVWGDLRVGSILSQRAIAVQSRGGEDSGGGKGNRGRGEGKAWGGSAVGGYLRALVGRPGGEGPTREDHGRSRRRRSGHQEPMREHPLFGEVSRLSLPPDGGGGEGLRSGGP